MFIKQAKKTIRRSRKKQVVLRSSVGDIWKDLARVSYSQEGEDLFLQMFFSGIKSGFYVDVGAHHPKRFSNTYLLYVRGWSWINIDPIPGRMELFRKARPKDVNLEVGISLQEGMKALYVFDGDAMTTFDRNMAERQQARGWKIVAEEQVQTRTLASVLDEYSRGREIDLLNVDTEGLDLEVLQSNDWSKYKPRVVCVEELMGDDDPVGPWLIKMGYRRIAITGRSRIYHYE